LVPSSHLPYLEIKLTFECTAWFLPCDAMRCTVFVIVTLSVCLSVRPSVCLSHSTWFDLHTEKDCCLRANTGVPCGPHPLFVISSQTAVLRACTTECRLSYATRVRTIRITYLANDATLVVGRLATV